MNFLWVLMTLASIKLTTYCLDYGFSTLHTIFSLYSLSLVSETEFWQRKKLLMLMMMMIQNPKGKLLGLIIWYEIKEKREREALRLGQSRFLNHLKLDIHHSFSHKLANIIHFIITIF